MVNKDIEEGLEIQIDFEKQKGLVPVIVQDAISRLVLMLGYANREALDITRESGYATFWSRSRNEIWTKGKTAGNFLRVREILVDCDQDSLIYLVETEGEGVCHTKDKNRRTRNSCFYRRITPNRQLEHID